MQQTSSPGLKAKPVPQSSSLNSLASTAEKLLYLLEKLSIQRKKEELPAIETGNCSKTKLKMRN